ncbi:four-carbon acid sugar kinase family protein [Frigidibacter sp.]|uniref:four-carbon acid sugar kinase family protein n=1 Tax=Frigidibacter sp. TaxID=2586418 RepID=UPI0027351233|nr:four-carbon acid sugar kinase family protein [Frigidibacter sp.]MDP3342161.1 four-carbon acid sugar kinase family protein [Frigidibacter sp.]
MKTLLIADDLTGALDSSAAFAARGLRVVCALSPADVSVALVHDPDILAVTTNSREIDRDQAVARIGQVLGALAAAPGWQTALLFKKIDSRLKGNLAAEVARLAPLRPAALACPAIPRLGRLVKNGALIGAGVTEPLSVATRLRLPQAHVLDAGSDAEIDTALARTGLEDTLFIGAAGLAEALARRLVPDAPEPQPVRLHAPALFAIGSRDPVTLAQLAALDPVAAPNGQVPEAPPGHLRIVQMIPGAEPICPAEASARFAEGVARWVREAPPATLLACGGESAAAILRNLGTGLLLVSGEALPGVPVSTMLDGVPGLQILTKSGGFGAPDTLESLAKMLLCSTLDPC